MNPYTRRRLTAGLAATALAAGGAIALAPTASAAPITVSNVTIEADSDAGLAAYAKVKLAANWAAEAPTAGDSFSIELTDDLVWYQVADFDLMSKDDIDVGDCHFGGKTLTCTLSEAAESYDRLNDGEVSASAQLRASTIGKNTVDVIVDGEPITVNLDSEVIGENATRIVRKTGQVIDNGDGTYTYRWSIDTTGATDYTVTESLADFNVQWVRCTPDVYWDTAAQYSPTYEVSGQTITFSANAADEECRVRLETTGTEAKSSNSADVNGQVVSREIELSASGSGSASGENNPTTPATEPATEEPMPEVTEEPTPEVTEEPTPEVTEEPTTPTTTEPTEEVTTPPTEETTSPTPEATEPEATPEETETPEVTEPTDEATTPEATEEVTTPVTTESNNEQPTTVTKQAAQPKSLARTGAPLGLAAIAAGLLGSGYAVLRRSRADATR